MYAHNNPTVHEGEYIIDDKRKIVVNTRDLTDFQYDLYQRSMYKRLRPDLTNFDFVIWKEKYRMGELYLNELKRRLNIEFARAQIIGHPANMKEFNKNFEEQALNLTPSFIKSSGYHIERTWEDASKITAYMTKIGNRIQKYNLDYPLHNAHIGADQAVELENKLVEKLVREMRKPPHKAAAAEEEASE